VVDMIDRIKQRARVLQRAAEQGEPAALQRLRSLRELRALPDEALREHVRRRHCLSLLARTLGLDGWAHLTKLWQDPVARDFGALLYPASCGGHWNIWSAAYGEAREIRAEHGGYLLPYRHQFVIVDQHFIADLGLDPNAAEWDLFGRDWVEPRDVTARYRLCRRLLEVRSESLAH
jgi:hypothetical protein